MTNKQARDIANWMFREAQANTSTGNWIIYYDEIEECFDVKMDRESAELIASTLCKLYPEAVLDAIVDENDNIDFMIGTNYYENDEDDEDGSDECWDTVVARELDKEERA